MILDHNFYENDDVVSMAQYLLGMTICTNFEEGFVSGIISETEAYKGPEDKACHAYQNKKTKRNEAMFEKGGILYMYLCYGIHHLCNIVTGPMNYPQAILIRAIQPVSGIPIMLKRRKKLKNSPSLTLGPGNVSQALGLNISYNKTSLINNDSIWIETHNNIKKKIWSGPRIGIDYAQESALLPWRFWIK